MLALLVVFFGAIFVAGAPQASEPRTGHASRPRDSPRSSRSEKEKWQRTFDAILGATAEGRDFSGRYRLYQIYPQILPSSFCVDNTPIIPSYTLQYIVNLYYLNNDIIRVHGTLTLSILPLPDFPRRFPLFLTLFPFRP